MMVSVTVRHAEAGSDAGFVKPTEALLLGNTDPAEALVLSNMAEA